MNLIIHELTNYNTAEQRGNRKPFCYTPLEHFSLTPLHPQKHVITLVVHVSTECVTKIQ